MGRQSISILTDSFHSGITHSYEQAGQRLPDYPARGRPYKLVFGVQESSTEFVTIRPPVLNRRRVDGSSQPNQQIYVILQIQWSGLSVNLKRPMVILGVCVFVVVRCSLAHSQRYRMDRTMASISTNVNTSLREISSEVTRRFVLLSNRAWES